MFASSYRVPGEEQNEKKRGEAEIRSDLCFVKSCCCFIVVFITGSKARSRLRRSVVMLRMMRVELRRRREGRRRSDLRRRRGLSSECAVK